MITSKKYRKKRFFYRKGERIAYLKLEDGFERGKRAVIGLEGRKTLTDANECVIWKEDLEKFGTLKIHSFLQTNLGADIGDAVFSNLEQDLGSFGILKEVVRFT